MYLVGVGVLCVVHWHLWHHDPSKVGVGVHLQKEQKEHFKMHRQLCLYNKCYFADVKIHNFLILASCNDRTVTVDVFDRWCLNNSMPDIISSVSKHAIGNFIFSGKLKRKLIDCFPPCASIPGCDNEQTSPQRK